ncbi:MAG: MTH1187 family thiamine-binding protein [Ignavibacteria bacterium]|nr:MTH1187 family thiamine-binding protein [Ignavibacteria bacterium]
MVLVEFSMFPTDKGESVSPWVSQVISHIDKSGLNYRLTPMGTIMEGNWDEVFKVISECFKILEPQCNRIYSVIKVDYRKGEQSRMQSKVEKVKTILNKEIKT